MAKKQLKTAIYIVETGQMYDTIAAAARAVGVDAANVRKVVRGIGKRSSVGGFHFAEVSSPAQIQAARERVAAQPVDKARARAERAQKRKLVEAVHDIMVDINKRARNAKKENMLATDPILQRLLQHASFYGYNKTGGYQTSRQHLREFTSEQLQNLVDLVEKAKKDYADYLYNPEGAHRNLASIAAQFAIPQEDLKKYWHVIPAIFELFRQANTGEWDYENIKKDLKSDIILAMQGDATPTDLRDFVLDLTNYYKGNEAANLDELLDKWSTTRETWEERWNEKKEAKW